MIGLREPRGNQAYEPNSNNRMGNQRDAGRQKGVPIRLERQGDVSFFGAIGRDEPSAL
jgi:hypothetical protein